MQHLKVRALLRTCTLWLLLGEAAALAAEPDIGRLRACAAESDDARRLACYDREIGRDPGKATDFGMTAELIRKKQAQAGIAPPQKQMLSASVTKVASQAFGRFVVTLDNGQVWSQEETLDFPVKAGDVVTIESGLLGGVWMEVRGRHLRTHVKRIR